MDRSPGRVARNAARRFNAQVNLRAGGLAIAIVFIATLFTILNPNFLTTGNLLGLLRAMSSLAIISLAQTLVIVSGELDLSVGALYGLAAMSMAIVWLHGWPLAVALLVALGLMVLAGGINAFFTVVVGIPSFIATLGMMSLARGVELFVSGAKGYSPAYAENYGLHRPPAAELNAFTALGASTLPFGIPIQVVWLVVLSLVFWFVLHRTLFGFRLTALGGNLEAARVARFAIGRYKLIVFVICAVAAGWAGILDFSFIGSVQPGSGLDLTFPVFAAVVIGGASLNGGRGTAIGTLMGAGLLSLLENGLALLGVGPYASLIFIGLVTIGAVTLDRLSRRREST